MLDGVFIETSKSTSQMILDTDEQTLKRPFDKPLSYSLLRETGCTMLVGSEHMSKIINLKIVRDILKLDSNDCKSDLERLELKIQQLEDKQHPDLWTFNYKGQEIIFNSSTYTDYDDFTGYEIGQVTTAVLHTDINIYVHTLQDFLDGVDKIVEYQIEQKKSFIIKKSNNGKTYQQSVQRNLLRKQRLPQFQTRTRSYCTPRLFRNRHR